ncbi:MAG: PIN domain-containing protein [Kiritimatiellaeota bacterium]|nr:PIN domain-containing protein [Kiritimatiellota bacterium]
MMLVDSTVYIDLLRQRQDPRAVLAHLLRSGGLRCCEIVRLEVLRGIISSAFRAEMEEFFDLVPVAPLNAAVWQRALELGWTLDRQGEVLPLTDLLIAACALQHGATLISNDRHFARIPGLKLWKKLPAPMAC